MYELGLRTAARNAARGQTTKSESARGRVYRRARPNDAKLLLRPQDAITQTKEARTRQFVRDVRARAATRAYSGRSLVDNPAILDAAVYYFEGLGLDIERRRNILAVGRRGAAATRTLQSQSVGAGNPGRTGAASTRPLAVPASAPAPARRAAPSAAPAQLPADGATVNAPLPASVPSRSPAPSGSPGRAPQTAPVPGAYPGWIPSALPLPKLSNVFASLLAPILPARVSLPRPSFVARPLPTTLTQPPTAPGLTPLNAPLLGFSQATSLGPVPKEELDKCKCPPKRTKSGPKCKNPVISRTVRDGIRTTKVRLQCPQSKLK